ncbi:MAG: hypothetical protein ACRDYY_18170 [Acidimicrobiales bacterium]
MAAAVRRGDRRNHPWLIVFLVVAAVWVAVTVSLQATRGGKAQPGKALPGWVNSLPGHVVSVDQENALLLSAPDGSRVMFQPSPASFDTASGLVVSPDGRYITDSWGDLLGTEGWRVVPNNIDSELDPSAQLAAAPFSDGGRVLVSLSTGATAPGASAPVADVSLVWPSDHHVIPLGPADDAAGDPRTPGAFVTVAASPLEPGGLYERPVADSAVEVVDVGVPARTVVTSDMLNRDLRHPSATPVNLTVYPDPAGDKVAVVVSPVDSTQGAFPAGIQGGVVILDRSGHLIGVGPPLNGPGRWQDTSHPVWSPQGRSLVYAPLMASGSAIAEWTTGGGFRTRPVADLATSASCLWAPNSAAILCPTDTGPGPGEHWLVGRTNNGRFVSVAAPGVPVAWVPSGAASQPSPAGASS